MTNGTASWTNGNSLSPCPFCNSKAVACRGLDWYVRCTGCPAALGENPDADGNPEGEYRTREEAVEAWNTRVAATEHDFSMDVHDGRTWVCVEGALESDVLKPIEGFTRDSIYRDSMREYGEWMEKATELMRDMWGLVNRLYIGDGEHIEGYAERLREFGIEVG